MPGKIFYRDRLKVGEGEKKPRFMVVAVAGIDMKVYGQHLRKKELEQIALAGRCGTGITEKRRKRKGRRDRQTKKDTGKRDRSNGVDIEKRGLRWHWYANAMVDVCT